MEQLDGQGTAGEKYADRLTTLESVWWKKLIPVQAPYRWNLWRLKLGETLDLGCGLGRNLGNLPEGSVGVDHNASSITVARSRGYTAFTPDEFSDFMQRRGRPFDSMLVAHVLEHLGATEATALVAHYLDHVRPGGTVVFITPQERGFHSDPTHIRWVDLDGSRSHARDLGLLEERAYSFPLPRPIGRIFAYNEFVWVGRRSANSR